MEKPVESEEKKREGDEGPPPAETILATTRDDDETVVAEAAIRRFTAARLAEWNEQIEAAVDSLEAFILSQGEAERATFADRGFFDYLGDRFIDELYAIAGGPGTPIMDAIAGEAYGTVSWAQHAESDTSQFLNYMRRGVRDATWLVRDNVTSIASARWPELLDLATAGSTDFIPALHAMGLPTIDFRPQGFADNLIRQADAYRRARAPQKDKPLDEIADTGKKQEIEEASKQAQLDEDAKKQAQTTTVTM